MELSYPQHDGRRWHNPCGMHEFSWLEGFKYQFFGRFSYPDRRFDDEFPQRMPNLAAHQGQGVGSLAVTWIGHATTLVTLATKSFLFDPFFSDRASPVSFAGPRRFRRPALDIDELPSNLAAVFISHNHYDHMDEASVLAIAQGRPNVRFYVPMGVGEWFDARGIGLRATEMTWWEPEDVPSPRASGNRVACALATFVPACHWSGRSLLDASKTLWGGWVVQAGGCTVYFSGDTGYAPYFKEIGSVFPDIDLAILPVGSYEPVELMCPHHCAPHEALQIHHDVNARVSIGVHYACLPSPVGVLAPRRELADAEAIGFRMPLEGETLVLERS